MILIMFEKTGRTYNSKMSFLIAYNGQFSPIVYPTPSHRGTPPVTALSGTNDVHEFRDVLEEAAHEEGHKKIIPQVRAYQKSASSFEAAQKRSYARDIMTSPVKTIAQDAAAGEAMGLLQKWGFRYLPVVNEKNGIVGMVTERELVSGAEKNKCKDLMIQKVVVCEESASVHEMAIIMLKEKINALPIVNHKHEMTGIVTTSDILKYVIESTSFLGHG